MTPPLFTVAFAGGGVEGTAWALAHAICHWLKVAKMVRSSAPTTGRMFILSASVSLPSTHYNQKAPWMSPGPPIGNGAVVLRRGQYRSPGDWRRLPAFADLPPPPAQVHRHEPDPKWEGTCCL